MSAVIGQIDSLLSTLDKVDSKDKLIIAIEVDASDIEAIVFAKIEHCVCSLKVFLDIT